MPVCDFPKLSDAVRAVITEDMACSRASGYDFWGFHELPSTDSMNKMCNDANCQSVIKAIRAAQPSECNTGGPMWDYYIYGQILDPIAKECANAPPPTTAAPPPTTTAPAPTTAPPMTTPPPTTAAPSSSAPTPTTAPSDGLSSQTNAPSGSSGLEVSSNQTVTVAPSQSTTNNNSSSATNKTSTTSSGMDISVIIAIVAGVVVVIALVAFLAFRAGRKKNTNPPSPYAAMDTTRNKASHASSDLRHVRESPVTGTSSAVATRSVPGSSQSRSAVGIAVAAVAGATGLWTDRAIEKARIPLEDIMMGDILSQGAFGEVLRGSYNGESVAIKRLLPARRKDMKEIESFLEEAKLLTSLRHQRIVGFVGVAWDSLTDLCIVTEFMDGGDLRSLLSHANENDEPTGFDANKVKIALHIIHALSYLHGLKPIVVHRDLKSKNVLLTRDLDAKLTDFGVSRERADKTMTANVGSSLWMAPEVMMGERYDEKADIFSFGVVLSELDTQKLPYSHAKEPGSDRAIPEMAMLNMVSCGKLTVAFTEGADPDMVTTGRACVAIDPKERPTASEVLYRMHQIYRGYLHV